MSRGFAGGVLWGGVVSVLGLGIISEVAPMPHPVPPPSDAAAAGQAAALPQAAAPEVTPGAADAAPAAGAPVADAPVSGGPAAEAASAPEGGAAVPTGDGAIPAADAPADAASADAAPDHTAPDHTAADHIALAEPAPAASGDAAAAAEGEGAAPAPVSSEIAPAGQASADPSAASALPGVPADGSGTAPEAMTLPGGAIPPAEVAGAEPAPVASPPTAEEALLTPAPEVEATPPGQIAVAEPIPAGQQGAAAVAPETAPATPVPPAVTAPEPPAADEAAGAEAAPLPAEPASLPPLAAAPHDEETLLPVPALPPVTGRLPKIGDPLPSAVPAAPGTDGTVLDQTDAPPVQAFARRFDNPQEKPVFAILLVDTGGPQLDREKLAAMPFPVTFVIDPLAPDAKAAEGIYRAAGQEVVMLATGIPAGATPADLEQTFQANAEVLPEAVAVVDLPAKGFQDDRALAGDVVGLIAAQGRGVVTFDRGLNAASQAARRGKVPSAVIFRSLDAESEQGPMIRRYLDRAAFKAAQEGRVAVIGQTRPETIAALMEWTVEGRAAQVALAPLTAVLAEE